MLRAFAMLFALWMCGMTPSIGAPPLPPDAAFSLSVARDAGGALRLTWTIAEGYYLYEDRFALKGDAGAVTFRTSPSELKQDPSFGATQVFHHRAVLTVDAEAHGQLTVTYQGCQEGGLCYMPLRKAIDAGTLAVTAPAASARDASPWTAPQAAPAAIAPVADPGNPVRGLLGAGGVPWVVGGFVLFGLVLAFTPCVFPLYPVLAAMLAREGGGLTAGRGFRLSATYVAFLALAFGLVGAVAGWTGQNLQLALQSPLASGAIAALFLLLALSMFGLFDLNLPAGWTTRIAKATGPRPNSYRAAALLGFSSALLIGPCVTAPLAGALLYIAQTQDWGLGALALFALGIGKGIPLILLATFGSGILPRAGAWMEKAKLVFGFGLLASAILVLSPLVPPGIELALWAGLALFAAAHMVSLAQSVSAEGARILARTLALGLGAYGLLLAAGAASGGTDPLRPLARIAARSDADAPPDFAVVETQAMLDAALARARQATRPALVYVTADWCLSCRLLERSVLADPEIRAILAGFDRIEIDVTQSGPDTAGMMQGLALIGPPTMLVFAPGGATPQARLVGEIDAATLRQAALAAIQ